MISFENIKNSVLTSVLIIVLLFISVGGRLAGTYQSPTYASNHTSFGMWSSSTPTADINDRLAYVNWYATSNFDWVVKPAESNVSTAPPMNILRNADKDVILETACRLGNIENPLNWTDIYNSLQGNKSLYNEALRYVVSQINESGVENLYAVTISEEEPQLGYWWNDSAVNVEHFIAVHNQMYDDLKAQFPGIKVFAFVHIAQFVDAQLTTLKKDGLVDDVYTDDLSVLSAWFQRMVLFGGNETYCIVHASSNYATWADLITPSIVRQTAELAQSMGVPHLGWFALDFSPPATKEILFNDWPACADPNDSHCPGNFKDTILDIVNMAQPTPTTTLTPTSIPTPTPASTHAPDNEWLTISYKAVEGSYIVLNYSVDGITPTYKKITFDESDGIRITMQVSKTVIGGAREVIMPSSEWVFPMFEVDNFMTGIDTVNLLLSLDEDATGMLYVEDGIGEVDDSSKSTSDQSPIQIDTFGDGIKDAAGSLLIPTALIVGFETSVGQYGDVPLGLTFTTGHSTNVIYTATNPKIDGAILASDGVPFAEDGGTADYAGTAGTIVATGTGDCLGLQLVGMPIDLQIEIKLVLEPTGSWETPTITPTPASTDDPHIEISAWLVIGFVFVILLVAIAMLIIRRRR